MFEIESKSQDEITITTKKTAIKFNIADSIIDANLPVGKIEGPGEFEIGDATIRGIATESGKTIYDVSVGGIHIGVLGGIEEKLDEMIAIIEWYVSDESYEKDKSYVASFTLTATGVPNYSTISFISGGVAVLLGIVLLYSVLGIWISGKKLVIVSIAVAVASVITAVILFRKEIATMMSIREYAPGMYVCNVMNDYKLDEFLSTDIKDSVTA